MNLNSEDERVTQGLKPKRIEIPSQHDSELQVALGLLHGRTHGNFVGAALLGAVCSAVACQRDMPGW